MSINKICANSNCYHGFCIEDALQGIHDAGFKYVELTATKGWTEHIFPNMSFEYLDNIKMLAEKLDLKPIALSGHCNLMNKKRLLDFENNIKLAHFFECDFIVTSIGEAHLEDGKKITNEEVVENIKSLLPLLEKCKIILVLEIHGEFSTGAILESIVKRVNSEWVKINYDTANAIFYGGVDPVEDIENCIENIAYMHLKDKAGSDKEWNFPALGEGNIDFSGLFKKLEKHNNCCPLSVEIEFKKNGPKDLKEVNQAIKDSFQYLEYMHNGR
ncbi:MAG: sugar phosphate isomerase/epimerase family protein [Lachnospiraceae bacterium]